MWHLTTPSFSATWYQDSHPELGNFFAAPLDQFHCYFFTIGLVLMLISLSFQVPAPVGPGIYWGPKSKGPCLEGGRGERPLALCPQPPPPKIARNPMSPLPSPPVKNGGTLAKSFALGQGTPPGQSPP